MEGLPVEEQEQDLRRSPVLAHHHRGCSLFHLSLGGELDMIDDLYLCHFALYVSLSLCIIRHFVTVLISNMMTYIFVKYHCFVIYLSNINAVYKSCINPVFKQKIN